MDYFTELKRDNRWIHERLNEEIDKQFESSVLPVHESLSEDRDILKDYLAKPGRGIGGSLVLRLAGLKHPGFDYDAALRVAAATELQNAGILIIDDWMDDSQFRKGQPTVHERYREIEFHRDVADARAVQLGMLAMTIATNIVSDGEYPGQLAVIRTMHHANQRIIAGTILENKLPNRRDLQTRESVRSVYKSKTGEYSFGAPIKSGLALAGVDNPVTLDMFNDFSSNLGLGFQIDDDTMGIYGKPEETGKPNTDDMRHGVYTLLYDAAKGGRRLKELYGKRDLSEDEAVECRELIRKSSEKNLAVMALQGHRWKYYDNAASALYRRAWNEEWNPATREYLQSMVSFLKNKPIPALWSPPTNCRT